MDSETEMNCTKILDEHLKTFDVPYNPNLEKCSSSIFETTETYRIMSCEDDLYIKSFIDKKTNLVSYNDREFVEVAKKKWFSVNQEKAKEMPEDVASEINRLWKLKREDIYLYPQFYKNCGNISLGDQQDFSDINFERICVLKNDMGQPLISVPLNNNKKFGKRDMVLPTTFLKGKSTNCTPPVSRDEVALELAKEKEVTVVVSLSGLKTLIDNHNNNPVSDWTLPFCVKEVQCEDGLKKRVLFVDKALPHSSMSKVQQKNWHGKKAVKSFISGNRLAFSEFTPEDLQLFEEADRDSKKKTEVGRKGPLKKKMCLPQNSLRKKNETSNLVKTFYSYELWKLEECGEKKNLMKNAKKNLKIIVRNKKPSTMKSDADKNYCVSSKLEYQEEFGGEILSLSQLTREWTSLLLNPEGCSIRVRADGNSLNFIRYEINNLATTEKNAKHFYNLLLKKQLNLLYIVFNNLVNSPEGQYLLRRTRTGGLFAYIFKAGQGKEDYNLYKDFSALTVKKEDIPWTEIDLSLLSPKIRISSYNAKASRPGKLNRNRTKRNKRLNSNKKTKLGE